MGVGTWVEGTVWGVGLGEGDRQGWCDIVGSAALAAL